MKATGRPKKNIQDHIRSNFNYWYGYSFGKYSSILGNMKRGTSVIFLKIIMCEFVFGYSVCTSRNL